MDVESVIALANEEEKIDDDGEEKMQNFKARSYQQQLVEMCIKRNTIIYLPTGAGKTFITLITMKHFVKDLLKPIDQGGKRSIFLSNTVVLAKQQAESIRRLTGFKTSVYTGDLNCDIWPKNKWFNEFNENQVIVATCQIIVDIVRSNVIRGDQFNIVVFDECHHARKNHPMKQLMNLIHKIPVEKQPRIIGLTGMLLIDSKPNDVLDDLNALEVIYRATIATVGSNEEFANVLLYSTKPQEYVQQYDSLEITDAVVEVKSIVNTLMVQCGLLNIENVNKKMERNETPHPLRQLHRLFNDFVYQLNDSGVYGASIAICSVIVELELKKREAPSIKTRSLYRKALSFSETIPHRIQQVMSDVTDEEDKIMHYGSPKLQHLITFLRNHLRNMKDKKELKALVFVERRYTAKAIYHVLKKYAHDNTNFDIRPDFIVGMNSQVPESIESVLQSNWTKSSLLRFKRGDTNLIVCSSVLEEGIDLQMCNLVVQYDPPKSFRSYVQSKGRARMQDSTYLMLIEKRDFSSVAVKLREYQLVSEKLKTFLIGKSIDRVEPDLDQVNREFSNDVIKPFRTASGAILEAIGAVSLLNRYCQTLPSDAYTLCSVFIEFEKVDGSVYGKLTMPSQSTVKGVIESGKMKTKSLAKQAAAFNACVLLYQKGELTENLLPVTKYKKLVNVKDLYFKHWENYVEEHPKLAGTNTRVRCSNLEIPDQLQGCYPVAATECFMYQISFMPNFSHCENDVSAGVFRDLLLDNRNFGILTTKRLPKLANILLFLTVGEIECNISSNPTSITIRTDNELQKLQTFHTMLFKDILNIWADFLACDTTRDKNCYIVVPTLDSTIDWTLVNNFQSLTKPCKVSEVQRAQMEHSASDYLNSVVSPWYRFDQKEAYVVVSVCDNMTPMTSFENESYSTYTHYYKSKYNVNVVQPDQFLVIARKMTSHLNRLVRAPNNENRHKTNQRIEYLVPELLHNFRMPGSIWLKATLIPSLLHRMHYLLNAENLREKICKFAGINDSSYEPVKLRVDKRVMKADTTTRVDNGRAVIQPNPNSTPTQIDEASGIDELWPDTWKDFEFPVNMTNFEKMYPIDIDYYFYFIQNGIKGLKLSEDSTIEPPSALMQLCNTDNSLQPIRIIQIGSTEPVTVPEQRDLLSAITTAGSIDAFSMERFEVLGDAFLKFSTSIFLMKSHPTWHEGFLTSVKSQIVSNRNLFYLADAMKLPGMIKDSNFEPKKSWVPPLIAVPREVQELLRKCSKSGEPLHKLKMSDEERLAGKLRPQTFNRLQAACQNSEPREPIMEEFVGLRYIGDKRCADSMESILGVCVQSIGIKKSLLIMQMMGILPRTTPLENMLDQPFLNARLTNNLSDDVIDEYLLNYKNLESTLGYKFKDRAYLLQALTHPSYPANQYTGCYQQLEFLGDAVLDFLITTYIYEQCEDMDPGRLTDLRSALVNNNTLGCLCVRNKLHLHILHMSTSFAEAMEKFVAYQEMHNHKITDQVQLLLLEGETELADSIDVPKALGDIVESLIGAVFLDSGNDLEIVWEIVYKMFSSELGAYMIDVPKQIVRRLYEYPGANPSFSEPHSKDNVVMVTCKFTCVDSVLSVRGFGQNQSDARRAAAKNALIKLARSK